MTNLAAKLAELGLVLPQPPVAVAAYVPYVIAGNFVFISGQLPMENGELKYRGSVGKDIDLASARAAAQLCALNLLAQINAACDGDISRVVRCVKLGGFVVSAPDFYDQPQVANGASELMEKIFGEAGRHARTTVGVSHLPKNASVEIDAIFEIELS
ncbi:MAG: RidA family protein [Pseudomonadota bacterium]|nr:RidA family protein [Pseudomonadota bacterium]